MTIENIAVAEPPARGRSPESDQLSPVYPSGVVDAVMNGGDLAAAIDRIESGLLEQAWWALFGARYVLSAGENHGLRTRLDEAANLVESRQKRESLNRANSQRSERLEEFHDQ